MHERRGVDQEHARDRRRPPGAAAKRDASGIHPALRDDLRRAPRTFAGEIGRVVERAGEVFRRRAAEEMDHATPPNALRESPLATHHLTNPPRLARLSV